MPLASFHTQQWYSSQEGGAERPLHPTALYGRRAELVRLAQALLEQKARLLGITGLGGVGKSALALSFAQSVQDNFELVVWYSLWNAPPPHTALTYFLNMVGSSSLLHLKSQGTIQAQLERLLDCLRQTRCLLILDNFETVLASGQPNGPYLAGYEGYGQLLELVGSQAHQSCLIVTSREKPKEFDLLEKRDSNAIFTLALHGLSVAEGRRLLAQTPAGLQLSGSEEEWAALVSYYSGNPLALKLLAEPLLTLFGGQLGAFLTQRWGTVGGIGELLDEQLERLSGLEQEILYWLGVERQALSLEELQADLRREVAATALGEGLASLQRRYLIEESEQLGYYGLQPVIVEYLTERVVKQLVEEIRASQVGPFLASYALLKAETKDYIRQSQRKLLLQPILGWLKKSRVRLRVNERLWELVAKVKTLSFEEQGYAGGNLLNLLVELKADLAGADFSRLRLWQAYLQGVPLEGVNFIGSDLRGCLFTQAFGGVEAVAFSPDGRTFASGGLDGAVRLWEVSTGQCLAVLRGHSNGKRVWSVAFSPDGKLLASGSADTTVRVWDLSSGQCSQSYQGHTDEVKSVAFSPDGTLLASVSSDLSVQLWEVATGQCLKRLVGHSADIGTVAFHPLGTLLASGSANQTIRLWEVATGQCIRVLTGGRDYIWSVAFSPDGTLLASGDGDHTIRLWEVASGQCLNIFQGHTNRVYAVAFSPDGTLLASGSSDQTIRLWEVASGQCLKVLEGHHNLVKSVSFSPNGELLVSGSPDQSVRLWQVESGLCLRVYEGYSSLINSVVYSPDGRYLAAASDDKTIRLWKLADWLLLKTLRGHGEFVKTVAFSPDSKWLASGSADHTIRLWELSSGRCLRVLEGYPSWVWGLAFSSDGLLLANGGNDHAVYVWEVASGQLLKVLEGHANFATKVAFSPDGKLLASSSIDKTVRLWEIDSGACLSSLEGHTTFTRTIAFSPDGQVLASGSADSTIRLWAVNSKECLKVLQAHSNWVWAIAFSPDGRYLVSSGLDGRVLVWDAKSWEYLFDLQGQTGIVRSLAFYPGGSLLAGGDENYVRVWDLESREIVQVMKNPGPYEGLNIFGVQGLSAVQEANLLALGALKTEPA